MTERVGLIGWPLTHSLSPFLHNRAFAACGLDWHYEALPVMAEALETRLRGWLAEGYRGFNVTIPHKQRVLQLDLVVERSAEVEACRRRIRWCAWRMGGCAPKIPTGWGFYRICRRTGWKSADAPA
jgi:hypothetical protein